MEEAVRRGLEPATGEHGARVLVPLTHQITQVIASMPFIGSPYNWRLHNGKLLVASELVDECVRAILSRPSALVPPPSIGQLPPADNTTRTILPEELHALGLKTREETHQELLREHERAPLERPPVDELAFLAARMPSPDEPFIYVSLRHPVARAYVKLAKTRNSEHAFVLHDGWLKLPSDLVAECVRMLLEAPVAGARRGK